MRRKRTLATRAVNGARSTARRAQPHVKRGALYVKQNPAKVAAALAFLARRTPQGRAASLLLAGARLARRAESSRRARA
ncbi:MAG TPA: hypothetical protein VNC78_00065 [Actinomycetota bacterium]|nr:hypothetical protein [Actinomycetota bacterium]